MIQNLNKILRERMPEMIQEPEPKKETSDEFQAILTFIEQSHNEIGEAIKVLAHNQRELLSILKRIEEKIDSNE